MNSRPILFSAPMVRALLDGTKTQTRRVVKPQPVWKKVSSPAGWEWEPTGKQRDRWGGLWKWPNLDSFSKELATRCPYGQVGDQLWVRETFCDATDGLHGCVLYRATGDTACKWKPSIFMPRAASRITLEITSVKVERLQVITFDEALKEGYPPNEFDGVYHVGSWYKRLWESINGAGSWDLNPWVWVIEFKRLAA